MPFCLIKPLANKFKQMLKNGLIDIEKLSLMTSAERRAFFSDFLGEANAKEVNALFEKNLLLKNKQAGMIRWAKQVSGISDMTRASLIERISKMEKVLNPESERVFLEDLAEKKLGVGVSFEEAKNITELSKKLMEAKKLELGSNGNNYAYGAARVAMENYLNDIRREANKMTPSEYFKNPVESVSRIAGFAKSLKASLDNSALFRQGFKAMFSHPKIWKDGAVDSFKNIWNQLKNKASDDSVMNAIKSEIYGRKNSINGKYAKMKLDIGTGEEAYPTSLPEKIPGAGRLFKASQTAYEGFLYKLRADLADFYLKLAEDGGVDLSNVNEIQSIGRLVNSLTGRGNLGSFEGAGKTINTVFFSPKNVKANVDFLTGMQFETVDGKRISSFARKEAAKNLLKVIVGTAVILGIAKAINNDSVDLDPRSSNFGKIRVGNTRFDVSGGMSSIPVLASRLISGSSKSSTTGNITTIGSGYGQTSGMDLVWQFFENKLSPMAGLIRNLINRSDFTGQKMSVKNGVLDLFAPLPITNSMELLNGPNSSVLILIALLADSLGLATNTYKDTSGIGDVLSEKNPELLKQLRDLSSKTGEKIEITNWKTSSDKGLGQLREAIGESEYMNGAFDSYKSFLTSLIEDEMKKPLFNALIDKEKIKKLNGLDAIAIKKVMNRYRFVKKIKK